MRFMLLCLMAAITAPGVAAQQRWQQLTGAAQAYSVDLESLERTADTLTARIRAHYRDSRIMVQQVQIRCASNQLRTVGKELYDADTGRPSPLDEADSPASQGPWPEYTEGSEGHALVTSLCALSRDRQVERAGDSLRRT